MENAQLITLSRQIALQRQMDVVANNMANINTNGFKSENMLFSDYLMPVAKDNEYTGADRNLHYTEDWSTVHDMSSGAIEQTGNPLDLALEGDEVRKDRGAVDAHMKHVGFGLSDHVVDLEKVAKRHAARQV